MISYYTDSFAFAKGERPSWLEYLIRFQFILTFHVWIKNSIKFLSHWNTFSVLSAISFNLSKFQRLKCVVFFSRNTRKAFKAQHVIAPWARRPKKDTVNPQLVHYWWRIALTSPIHNIKQVRVFTQIESEKKTREKEIGHRQDTLSTRAARLVFSWQLSKLVSPSRLINKRAMRW